MKAHITENRGNVTVEGCKSKLQCKMPNCRREDTELFDQVNRFLHDEVIPAIREYPLIRNEAVNVVVNAFLEAGLDMMVHDRLHLAG